MTALWQNNNAEIISPSETNNCTVNSQTFIDNQKARNEKNAEENNISKEPRADNILENQRKNNKNEINAKMNNQEHHLEIERQNDKDQKIRKIDLKAYGFENEFFDQRNVRQQRVVNKLDLKSFGYQDGVRYTRSNNQDQLPTNKKSNLTRCMINHKGDYMENKEYLINAPKSLSCKDFTKSLEDLNKLHIEIEKVDSLLSAKSMPNVTDDVYYYANPVRVNDDEQDESIAKNLLDHMSNKSEEVIDECNAKNMNYDNLLNDYDEISSDIDTSFENMHIRNQNQFLGANEKISMPSVKKLAEMFGRRQTSVIEAIPMKRNKTLVTNKIISYLSQLLFS